MSVNPNATASQHEPQAQENGQKDAIDLKEFFQTFFKVGDTIEVAEKKKRQGRTGGEIITRGKIIQIDPKLITYHTGNYRLSVGLNDVLIRGYKISKVYEAGQAKNEEGEEHQAPTLAQAANAQTALTKETLEAAWREKGNIFDVAEALDISTAQAKLLLIQYGIMGAPIGEGQFPKEPEKQGEEESKVEEKAEEDAAMKEPENNPVEPVNATEPDKLEPEPEHQPEPEPAPAKKSFPAKKPEPSYEDLFKAYLEEVGTINRISKRFGVSDQLAKKWLINAGILDAEMPGGYRSRGRKKQEQEREQATNKESKPLVTESIPVQSLPLVSLPGQDDQNNLLLERLGDLKDILMASTKQNEAILLVVNAIEKRVKFIDRAVAEISQIIGRTEEPAPQNKRLSEIEIIIDIMANISLLLAGMAGRNERGGHHAD